jgi:methionine-gamma-lyase
MTFDAADGIQDIQNFGEFGGVNPSITDSSTFTFLKADKMEEIFEHEIEGCYLYARHWNPMTKYLANALSILEDTESATVTGSGMGAISATLMQICSAGDEIVSSRTIYGGTYALMKHFLPKFQVKTNFVDITNLKAVEQSITSKTKVIYCETLSNPLLEISDISKLSAICKKHNLKLVVDNTFTPLIITPSRLGADVVIHSLTKFINGSSDCVAGVVCASKEFCDSLLDVNNGAAMLLGPVLDSLRASSILKNLRTLHLRMKQHSENASYLAEKLQKLGIKVYYPQFKSHPNHELFNSMMNKKYGYGGMLLIDVGTKEKAYQLMELMQNENVGYLAVSLGFYKTLFSSPGSSTSSEISVEEQKEMGLSEGFVRMSVGLDSNIENTLNKITLCLKKCDCIQ